ALEWYTFGDPCKWTIWGLMEKALEWYNIGDPCKWKTWGPMAKAFMERFQLNIEIDKEFEYYEIMFSMMGYKFSKIINMEEALKDIPKTGKVVNVNSLQATNKVLQASTIRVSKKNK
ncbi:hypothetical protein HAX54_027562, partial [Datura stramonium]|nr:hypothetical protein [Datura stramonium]